MAFPWTANPIADGEVANAARWWQRVIKPVVDAQQAYDNDDTGWIAAGFNAPWTNHGLGWPPAQYRRHNGIVWLAGLVQGGAASTTIFTMPGGFRPDHSVGHLAICSGGAIRLTVQSDGQLVADTFMFGGTNAHVGLFGISYKAA